MRHVNMLDGVEISESKAQKDELILEGNDIDNVSQSGVSSLRVQLNLPNTFVKLPQFKVFAVYERRTSENSWMVFTCQRDLKLRTIRLLFDPV